MPGPGHLSNCARVNAVLCQRHNSPTSSRSERPWAPPPPPLSLRSIISEDGQPPRRSGTGYAGDKANSALDFYSYKPVSVRMADASLLPAHKIPQVPLHIAMQFKSYFFMLRQHSRRHKQIQRLPVTQQQRTETRERLISTTGSIRRNNGKPNQRPSLRMSHHPHLSWRRVAPIVPPHLSCRPA